MTSPLRTVLVALSLAPFGMLTAQAADGFPDVVAALIAGKADVNALDDEKRSPLDLARLMDNGDGTREVIARLVAAGAHAAALK